MRIEAFVRTTTEVDSNTGFFIIECVADYERLGNRVPEIHKARVLDKAMEIDNTEGLEGELLISHVNSSPGKINEKGEYILNTDNESPQNFWREEENLMNYEE